MNTLRNPLLLPSILLALGCGSEGGGGDTSTIDPEIPCREANCGESRFRSAVPARDSVRIQFGSQARVAPSSESSLAPNIGRAQRALESTSPALLDTDEYVAEINGLVDGLFDNFEDLAGSAPEEESELLHVWRRESPEDASLDELLIVTAIDDETFSVELRTGDTGLGVDDGVALVYGEVVLDDEERKTDFSLTIDLDAFSEVVPSAGITGDILLSGMPLDGGLREVWYDYHDVGPVDGETESRRTTYWIFAPDDGALEFLSDIHNEEATAFVRWDAGGGRYDHHVAWNQGKLGFVDEIVTNCWDASGAELFDGYAMIADDGSYYGELDGEEGDCEFGPVDGHPDPSEEFADLPGDGEWQDLEFESVEECDPNFEKCDALCYDDPEDPNCIPWCDDEPSDPDCVWYCDYIDDPEYCN